MLIELGLVGGDRLDLDDLFRVVAPDYLRDDAVCLLAVPRPVHLPPGLRDGLFQLQEVVVEVAHRALLEGVAGLPEVLPVRHLPDDGRPLFADGLGSLAEVAAQLGVGEALSRGYLEVRGLAGGEGVRFFERHGCVLSSVAASISARWTVFTPARWRLRPPPMCIRHELSPAVQISASVSSTCRILSDSIAAEVSAFLTANVPPKPQHSFASPSSTRSMPRTALRSSSGASPTLSIRREWQGGGRVTLCGGYAPTSVTPSL